MNRHIVKVLVVLAVVAIATFVRPEMSRAEEGSVAVRQANVQVAVNVAVYCPDVTQSIAQVSANVAAVITGAASDVSIAQTNVQVAYNIAVYSPGASQTITQVSGTTTTVTTTSDAAATVNQSNTQVGYNFSVQSGGSSQAIAQAASNAASVTTGSATLTSAVTTVINQSNVQFALNLCIGSWSSGDTGVGWGGALLTERANGYSPPARSDWDNSARPYQWRPNTASESGSAWEETATYVKTRDYQSEGRWTWRGE